MAKNITNTHLSKKIDDVEKNLSGKIEFVNTSVRSEIGAIGKIVMDLQTDSKDLMTWKIREEAYKQAEEDLKKNNITSSPLNDKVLKALLAVVGALVALAYFIIRNKP